MEISIPEKIFKIFWAQKIFEIFSGLYKILREEDEKIKLHNSRTQLNILLNSKINKI